MKSRHMRTLGSIVGLVAVLGAATIAASEPLSAPQISRQIEHRLSKEGALENVRVSVQESVVRLSGTVPSLWAKQEAIKTARELGDGHSVVSDALEIEHGEGDLAIAEQSRRPGDRRARRAVLQTPLYHSSRGASAGRSLTTRMASFEPKTR